MSGAEASLVIGLISGVVSLLQAAHEVYEAAGDVTGLPKKFRAAADQIPMILYALSLAEENVKSPNVSKDGLKSAKPVLESCEKDAQNLKEIFDNTVSAKDAPKAERYKKALAIKFKSGEVKDLMEQLLKNMELLAQHQIFQDAQTINDIQEAVRDLEGLRDENEHSQNIHHGSGNINENSGSGSQDNSTYNNSGAGKMYAAKTMSITGDSVETQYRWEIHNHSSSASPNNANSPELHEIPISRPDVDLESHLIEKGSRTKNTCKWILQEDAFIQYDRAQGINILGITGIPGSGKTTMSTFLVDHIRKQRRANTDLHFGFFFCVAKSPRRSSALAILRGILYLICKNKHILGQVQEAFRSHDMSDSGILSDFNVLWQIFTEIILNQTNGYFLILIDALDECEEKERHLLLNQLNRLRAHYTLKEGSKFNLNLILTCRQDRHFRPMEINPSQIVRMTLKNISGDIEKTVLAGVDELHAIKSYDPVLKHKIQTALLKKNGGNHLWVSLALKQLKKTANENTIARLDSIPEDLFKFYDQILRGVSRKRPGETRLLLHLLLVTRDLDVARFALALYMVTPHGKATSGLHKDTKLPNSTQFWAAKGRIPEICSDLISIDSTGVLRFIHPSVMDYLVSNPVALSHVYPTSIFEAIFILAIFLEVFRGLPPNKYLLITLVAMFSTFTFRKKPLLFPDISNLPPWSLWMLRYLPLVNETRWFYHVHIPRGSFWAFTLAFQCLGVQGSLVEDSEMEGTIERLQVWAKQSIVQHAMEAENIVEALFPWKSDFVPSKHVALEIWLKLSARGGPGIYFLQNILSTKVNVDTTMPITDEFSGVTPLAVAATAGSWRAVDILLKAHADRNIADSEKAIPLVRAALGEHLECVKLLIPGSDVDMEDADGDTILMDMLREDVRLGNTFYDNIEVYGEAEVFIGDIYSLPYESLEHSVWANSLLPSPSSKVETIANLLAEAVQDLDKTDSRGMTAMAKAARNHQWRVVKTLLDCGADPNIQDAQGMSALLWALRSPRRKQIIGSVSACENSRVWIGSATIFYERETFFESFANEQDSETEVMDEVLQRLISTATKIDMPDFTGRSALSLAAENGYPPVVDLLIDAGADVNLKDPDSKTPLIWACQKPYYREVNAYSIQAYGAAKVFYGPLLATIRNTQSPQVFKYPSPPTRTKLRWAAVQSLIYSGANLDCQDRDGLDALHYSTLNDLLDISAMLRQTAARNLTQNAPGGQASSIEIPVSLIGVEFEHQQQDTFSNVEDCPQIDGAKVLGGSVVLSAGPGVHIKDTEITSGRSYIAPTRAMLPFTDRLDSITGFEFQEVEHDDDIAVSAALRRSLDMPWHRCDCIESHESATVRILDVMLEIKNKGGILKVTPSATFRPHAKSTKGNPFPDEKAVNHKKLGLDAPLRVLLEYFEMRQALAALRSYNSKAEEDFGLNLLATSPVSEAGLSKLFKEYWQIYARHMRDD